MAQNSSTEVGRDWLPIDAENLADAGIHEIIWLEIEFKTMLYACQRFRMAPDINEFRKKFKAETRGVKRAVRFSWDGHVLLEITHNYEKATAKIFTGVGSVHGEFTKEPKQGDLISSWREFIGTRNNRPRALPRSTHIKELPDYGSNPRLSNESSFQLKD